jgi:hypothetical protein
LALWQAAEEHGQDAGHVFHRVVPAFSLLSPRSARLQAGSLEGERLPVKTPVQALVLLTVYLVLDAADEPRPLRIPSIRLRFVSSPTIARAFW